MLGEIDKKDWVLENGQKSFSGFHDNFSVVTVPAKEKNGVGKYEDCELMLFWIEQRGEWVAIIYKSWNECGLTDDSYSGPFSLDQACLQEVLRAYGVPDGKVAPKAARDMSPSELKKFAKGKLIFASQKA